VITPKPLTGFKGRPELSLGPFCCQDTNTLSDTVKLAVIRDSRNLLLRIMICAGVDACEASPA